MTTHKKFALPTLPYDLHSLEPLMSRSVLDVHYNKHHKTYVDTLNIAMAQLNEAMAKEDLPTIVSLQPLIAFNGGSHICHSMFWENLSPVTNVGGKLPTVDSPFHKRVIEDWGSFDKLMNYFTQRTIDIKGSGWSWLVMDRMTRRLEYRESHDQNSVTMEDDVIPLLNIDAWEHAYALDYKTADYRNARLEYMKNIWKIINWDVVQQRFLNAMSFVK